jgi:hypothetical protein
VAELSAAIVHLTELLERGRPAEAAIAAFNADTNHRYTAYDFLADGANRSIQAFALEAARPAWPRVESVSRKESEVVRRVLAGDDDIDFYVLLLQANVDHPRVTDLIFRPPPELFDASPGAIVDAALSYRPIAL